MNTLIENVNYVATYTDDIKDALEEQGENVPAGDGLSTLAGHVRNISTGPKKELIQNITIQFSANLFKGYEYHLSIYNQETRGIVEELTIDPDNGNTQFFQIMDKIYTNIMYYFNFYGEKNGVYISYGAQSASAFLLTDKTQSFVVASYSTLGPSDQDLVFSNLTNTFLDSPVHDLSQCNFDNAKDCGQAFRGCVNLDNFISKLPSATSLYFTFSWCSSLTNLYLDTSNCTNFNNAFRYCENLTSLTINLTKATDVGEMLKGCTKLESFYINGIFGKDTNSDLILDLSETKIGILESGQIPWNFKQFCLNLETYSGQFNRQFKVTQDLYNEFIQTADYTELQNKNYKLIY